MQLKLSRLFRISLFWRTFVLLVLLILASSVVWFVSFRTLESDSRAMISARQISSAVNLTRSSLVHADAIYRTALIKSISEQEGLYIRPREAEDKVVPYELDNYRQMLQTELQRRLGNDTVISDNVNGMLGLWVSFAIQGDKYWLQTEPVRIAPVNSQAWLYWVAIAIGISLFGAAIIAGLLNRPLKKISIAVNHVRLGNFEKVNLQESLLTTELQDLNRGFNQMSAQLSKVEVDRAVMLAGISHDLRTPLARLRLETELSVDDKDARTEMSQDIEQINAILSKFLDYARPHATELQAVNLGNIVSSAATSVNNTAKVAMDVVVTFYVPENLLVMADPIELSRVLSNLLENARRYGKSTIDLMQMQNESLALSHDDNNNEPEAWQATRMFDEPLEIAQVHIDARIKGKWVVLTVKDYGKGVPEDVLNQLKVPFFRANEARSNTNGTGLGLAIVEKAVQGMQGKVRLSNWGPKHKNQNVLAKNSAVHETDQGGGFMVEIRLNRPA